MDLRQFAASSLFLVIRPCYGWRAHENPRLAGGPGGGRRRSVRAPRFAPPPPMRTGDRHLEVVLAALAFGYRIRRRGAGV